MFKRSMFNGSLGPCHRDHSAFKSGLCTGEVHVQKKARDVSAQTGFLIEERPNDRNYDTRDVRTSWRYDAGRHKIQQARLAWSTPVKKTHSVCIFNYRIRMSRCSQVFQRVSDPLVGL